MHRALEKLTIKKEEDRHRERRTKHKKNLDSFALSKNLNPKMVESSENITKAIELGDKITKAMEPSKERPRRIDFISFCIKLRG